MNNNDIYELKLKPISPWLTPLQADTIFGHLCWRILYQDGEDVLKEFLREMKEKPFFVLSDALPAGYVYKPVLDWEFAEDKEDTAEKMEIRKKYKKIRLIKDDDFKRISRINSRDDFLVFQRELTDRIKEYKALFAGRMDFKNSINRLSGTTKEGCLYSLSSEFTKYELRLLVKVFIEDKLSKFKIKERLKSVFLDGYGKKKSVGYGHFKIINDWAKFDKFNNFGDKRFLLLSNFIPHENDSREGFYSILVKYGKTGEYRSMTENNFYKKPLIFIQGGATFKANEKYRTDRFVGGMIDNVAYGYKDVYQYAYGFCLEF